MKKLLMTFMASAALVASAARNGPWTKEQAWEWYARQPWMRGCNYMPASCANRVDQWQEMGCEERFAEMERELKLAQSIGFNTLRILIEEQGFAVWCAEHDGFMARLERMLALLDKYGMPRRRFGPSRRPARSLATGVTTADASAASTDPSPAPWATRAWTIRSSARSSSRCAKR